MKTEKEMVEALQEAMTNAIRSDSIEQLRFYQGKIEILEWYFAKERKDGFSDAPEHTAEVEKKE